MFYKVNLNFHEDMQRSASMICENKSMHGRGEVRLSPIGDSYGHLNLKWVAGDPNQSPTKYLYGRLFLSCLRGTT